MDARTQHDLLQRLKKLERESTRLRRGEVTDDSPLSVSLGGGDVPFTDVPTIASGLAIGDQVIVLTARNNLVVLGKLV